MPETLVGKGLPGRDWPVESMQVRIHNGGCQQVIIYLPGTHGDWTLAGGFRRALGSGVSLVEVTYPRTTTWSLAEYAARVAEALRQAQVRRGWLLGESFGSQIVWEMLNQKVLSIDGVILAGGFAQHPFPWMARAAAALMLEQGLPLLRLLLAGYVKSAKFRFRRSPEILDTLSEFAARRTKEDYLAARHRLRLVASNDPRKMVHGFQTPVYALTGFFDPIVPWPFARQWFKRHCPALADYRIVWNADHNVLGTAPKAAALQVLDWVSIKGSTVGLSRPVASEEESSC